MEHSIQQIQFLDLDDVDSQEIEYIQSVLYSLRSTHLELPWVDEVDEIHWDQHHYDGNGGELNVVGGGEDNGGSSGGGGAVVVTEVYEDPTQQAQQIPQQVPQQVAVTMHQVPSATTTMHQMYHPAVVPQMPNLAYVHQQNMGFGIPPPAAFHAPPPPPQQQGLPYDDRGRRPRSSKPSPKRGPREAYPPPPHQYTPQYPPLHMAPPYQYIPSAQHATGPPLYLAPPPPLSMYPTLYSSYTPVFSPHMQQPQPHDEMKEPPPPHQPPPQVYPVEKQDYLEEELAEEPPQQPSSHTPPQQPPLLQAPPPPLQQPQPQPQPPPPMQPQPAMPSPPLPLPPVVPQPHQQLPSTPPPQVNPVPPEKPPVKSLPINAIKTTAPPSLTAKRRPQLGEEPPPPMAPQPQPGKSWAGLFKTGEESSTPSSASPLQAQNVAGMVTTPAAAAAIAATPSPNQQQPPLATSPASAATPSGPTQRAPPINAVVVTAPPHMKTTLPQPPLTTKPAQHDPQLKKLGDVLSTYQLEHRAIVLTPRGLTNPSNYCYINATLQALLACPAFYNLISIISNVKQHTPSNNQNAKSKTPIIDSMVQFIKEFSPAQASRMMRREKAQARRDKDENSLDMHTGVPFEPNYVYKMLHALRSEDSSFTEEGRQEDAEEFLSLLLNGLNDEMLELLKLVEEPKPAPVVNGDVTSNGDTHPEDNSDWKEVTNRGMRITRRAELERTPLSDIFRGQLRSSLLRENEEISDNIQPFFTLQLDIESSDSVAEALEKLVGKDLVEGTSRGEVNTWQTHTLDLLPCVLILHLKCFHYKQQTCSKIVKALQFPIDLKLDQKLLSNKNKSGLKSRQYKLFAVVYHDGKEATKGHYLSDVFHVGTSGWIRYDDAVVRSVPETQVLNPPFPRVPYLLYYRRQDTIGQQSGQQQQQQQQQQHSNTQQSMAGQLTAANNQHHQR